MPRRPMRRGRPAPRGYALLDAILGGVLLAVALAAVLSLAARALELERRGEREVIAAALLDELLAMVLVEGPVDFSRVHDTAGNCAAPYEAWEYEIVIDAQGLGDPSSVVAIVRDPLGGVHTCGTLIAPRPADAEPPPRRPTVPLEREERYEERRQSFR